MAKIYFLYMILGNIALVHSWMNMNEKKKTRFREIANAPSGIVIIPLAYIILHAYPVYIFRLIFSDKE